MLRKRARRSAERTAAPPGRLRRREEEAPAKRVGIAAALETAVTGVKGDVFCGAAWKTEVEGLFSVVDDNDDGWRATPRSRAPVNVHFLSACDLCTQKLHGADIYIYRGEKAFCSAECRWHHMVAEQLQEHRCSELF
ncbi:uncharacterized protein LOC144713637 isoform X2 [Wolffia australiana]